MALHLHELGDPAGRPLICLHGLGGHGGRYRRLAGLLEGRRVLAPDLRGHGRSTADPPWSTEQHVADVLETVTLDGPADWLGFSFGGRLAAAIAATRAELVARLVLLDPALTLPPAVAGEHALEALEPVGYASAQEAVDGELAAPTLLHTPRELMEEEVAEHFARGPDGRLTPRVSRAMAVTAWSEMARPAPPAAPVPTLVVTGEQSWIPVDVERLAPARHVVVPGGHSVLWDALPAVADAVRAFLG
jgi:lipase